MRHSPCDPTAAVCLTPARNTERGDCNSYETSKPRRESGLLQSCGTTEPRNTGTPRAGFLSPNRASTVARFRRTDTVIRPRKGFTQITRTGGHSTSAAEWISTHQLTSPGYRRTQPFWINRFGSLNARVRRRGTVKYTRPSAASFLGPTPPAANASQPRTLSKGVWPTPPYCSADEDDDATPDAKTEATVATVATMTTVATQDQTSRRRRR